MNYCKLFCIWTEYFRLIKVWRMYLLYCYRIARLCGMFAQKCETIWNSQTILDSIVGNFYSVQITAPTFSMSFYSCVFLLVSIHFSNSNGQCNETKWQVLAVIFEPTTKSLLSEFIVSRKSKGRKVQAAQ